MGGVPRFGTRCCAGASLAGTRARRIQARSLVRHVVMFNFKEGVSEQQKVGIQAAFDAMPAKIPQIKGCKSGLDMLLASGRNHPAGKNRDFVWWCDLTASKSTRSMQG